MCYNITYSKNLKKDVANLKRKRIAMTALSLLISALIVVFSVITVMAYSSDEDPLITLSYLNEIVIPKLKAELSQTNNSASDTNNTQSTDTGSNEYGTYETLELNIGDTLLAKSALEIIVRPGSIVTAVSPFDSQGVADITNGKELYNGDEFSINAYCIIPRGNDGRGIRVFSEKAYVLVRGEYEIG